MDCCSPGIQDMLVQSEQESTSVAVCGVNGWIGMNWQNVSDEELSMHLLEAWRLIDAKQKKGARLQTSSKRAVNRWIAEPVK